MQPAGGKQFEVRAFVALNPPPETIAKLTEVVRRWQRRLGTVGVNWVTPKNIHLTLEFLGNVPVTSLDALKARLQESCAGVPAFTIKVAGAGCFPDFAHPKVLWLGLQGEQGALDKLAASVSEATKGFGQPRDGKPFSPHLTVARFEWPNREQIGHVRRMADRPEESDVGPWRVDKVDLMRSEPAAGGSVYTVLESVPLG